MKNVLKKVQKSEENQGFTEFFGGGYNEGYTTCFGGNMEKRKYQRARINIEGLFYIQGGEYGKIEFIGVVKNMSEDGIAIEVTRKDDIEIADTVDVGSEIKFMFLDEYEVFKETRMKNVVGMATVVRKEKTSDKLILGCRIPRMSRELQQYIDDKKVILYLEKGFLL